MWVFEAENSQVWFSPGRVSEQLRTWLRHRQHPARIEVLRGEDVEGQEVVKLLHTEAS